MDYESLDKIFSKYESIGSYVHRDRFDSLYEDILELHDKSVNKSNDIQNVSTSVCLYCEKDGNMGDRFCENIKCSNNNTE